MSDPIFPLIERLQRIWNQVSGLSESEELALSKDEETRSAPIRRLSRYAARPPLRLRRARARGLGNGVAARASREGDDANRCRGAASEVGEFRPRARCRAASLSGNPVVRSPDRREQPDRSVTFPIRPRVGAVRKITRFSLLDD